MDAQRAGKYSKISGKCESRPLISWWIFKLNYKKFEWMKCVHCWERCNEKLLEKFVILLINEGTRDKEGGRKHSRPNGSAALWMKGTLLISVLMTATTTTVRAALSDWLTDRYSRAFGYWWASSCVRKETDSTEKYSNFFLLASFGGNTTRFERSSKSYFLPNWKIQLMGQSIFKSPKNDNFTIEWNKNSQKVVKWPLSDNKSKHLPIFWQNIIFALRNGRRT